MRVRRMPAKKRYQVMTRLARQRAREAGQEEILVIASCVVAELQYD